MKKTIKMLAMSAFCVVLAGAPAFAEGKTNNDPTCLRSSVAFSVELDQTWKNALNNNDNAIEVFEQLLAGGLDFDPNNNALYVIAGGSSPFQYPVLYSYNGTNIDSGQAAGLYFKVGAATEITVTAAFPTSVPLQYGYLHFEVNEDASPVDFVLLKNGSNFESMQPIEWVDGVPKRLGNVLNASLAIGKNIIGTGEAFNRDGYGLRGWTIYESLPYVTKTSVALNGQASDYGFGIAETPSNIVKALELLASVDETLYFDAYPAYAAECSANTISSADSCDANIADSSAICSLTIEGDGAVSYTNGCCPGFSLADSTATE